MRKGMMLFKYIEEANIVGTHLLLSTEQYRLMLGELGMKSSVTVIDFYDLKTIVTDYPLELPRILYLSEK